MFDIGFSELLLFGIIALIVLGPEKLPKAARTAGQWYAKIRRTVSTLQSEIEAELDLAETRQQMQEEIAKIRQTEAEMRREMAEMRGSMREFEYAQNHSLHAQHEFDAKNHVNKAAHQSNKHDQDKPKQAPPAEFNYDYESDHSFPLDQVSMPSDTIKPSNNNDSVTTTTQPTTPSSGPVTQPIITRPWENMWFRLGAYDKARRLPPAPFLPNYKADPLLNISLSKQGAAK